MLGMSEKSLCVGGHPADEELLVASLVVSDWGIGDENCAFALAAFEGGLDRAAYWDGWHAIWLSSVCLRCQRYKASLRYSKDEIFLSNIALETRGLQGVATAYGSVTVRQSDYIHNYPRIDPLS